MGRDTLSEQGDVACHIEREPSASVAALTAYYSLNGIIE